MNRARGASKRMNDERRMKMCSKREHEHEKEKEYSSWFYRAIGK